MTVTPTLFATLGAVFPYVQTWATMHGDLLLVGSGKPVVENVGELRRRLDQEPFRSGVAAAWRVTHLEGVRAHFVGDDQLSRYLGQSAAINTDDRMVLEYAFARTMGRESGVDLEDLHQLAALDHQDLPYWTGGTMAAQRVIEQRATSWVAEDLAPPPLPDDEHYARHTALMRAYLAGDYAGAVAALPPHGPDPADLTELAVAGEALAESGNPAALTPIAALRAFRPAEADFILAALELKRHDLGAATTAYEQACAGYRRDPWTWPVVAARALPIATDIAHADSTGAYTARLYAALAAPFAVNASNLERQMVRVSVAERLDGEDPGIRTREALAAFPPSSFPWEGGLLGARAACYQNLHDPRAASAVRDLEEFRAQQGSELPPPLESPPR